MNIKKTVRKMSAVLAGATMLGATITGALALDLGDYPQPLVKDGVLNGKVVVGQVAATSDVLGAIDLAMGLRAAAKTPVSISGGVVSVDGGWSEEFDLNTVVTKTLDDIDLVGFQDKTIRFNKQDYDIRESLTVDGITFQTNTAGDKDFETGVYMTTSSSNKIVYTYTFEDEVPTADMDASSPLKIDFLGKTLEISSIDAASMTMVSSTDLYLEEGDSVTLDGFEVKLIKAGDTSVIISVDGEQKILSGGNSHTFSGEFDVELDSSFEGVGASFKAGSDISMTVGLGDSLELFGEPKKKENAEWVWDWDANSTHVISVSAQNNIPRNRKDVSYEYERAAVAVGESFGLPNDYATFTFAGFKDEIYNDLRIEFRNIRFDSTLGYENVTFLSTDNRVFYVEGERTSEVAINGTDVWYKDSRGDWLASTLVLGANASQVFTFKIDADPVTLDLDGGDLTISFPTDGGAEVLTLDTDSKLAFGTEGEAGASDLLLGATPIGTQDYGRRLTYGAYFEAPKGQMERDRFTVSIPRKQLKAVLVVGAKGTKTTVTQDSGAYQLSDAPAYANSILDTEAMSLIGNTPLLVVGGPRANTVAASLLGNPGDEEIAAMFQPGRAMIKLFADKNAILVAGYSAQDTLGATYALADYAKNKASFTGKTEVEVVVPNLNNIQIRAPTAN